MARLVPHRREGKPLIDPCSGNRGTQKWYTVQNWTLPTRMSSRGELSGYRRSAVAMDGFLARVQREKIQKNWPGKLNLRTKVNNDETRDLTVLIFGEEKAQACANA